MATYRQLLLSTGGGVISGSQQDEQNKCATVAIGLGGTGVACLRNLKRQVYSRLQPDNPDSPIPEYAHIRFLAVDSDKSSLQADGAFNSLDEATEYFSISTGDINGLLSETKTLAGNPECRWLKTEDRDRGEPGLSILSATAGAGGVRQIGRLLLIEKSAEFVARIQKAVSDATRGIQGNAELIIHIFTGMGGGTGSGTFLDVCYLVQAALERMALKGRALTCGYFFLPDVNLSSPGIEEESAVARYIKANGFAAMKELDYCMNFQNNHGCWDQEYKSFHVGPTQETPVKVCHLISAHDIKGSNLQNGYAYAMNVVSDFVMQFLVKPVPSQKGNALTMQSHISNYFKSMSVVNKTAGANYQYCLLGASNAIVPMKEITTYLASRLFEEMSSMNHKLPTDQEVAYFAEANGLSYTALQESLLSGTTYRMPAIELDHRQFSAANMSEQDLALQDDLILPDVIMKPYRDKFQSSMINQVVTNMNAMTNDWSIAEVQKDQVSASKVCAAYFALRNLVIDSRYGPFYAADMLKGAQTTNLVNHLWGIQKQAENDLTSAGADVVLHIQHVKKTRRDFLHAGLLANKRRLFEEFIGAVASYFTLTSYIELLRQMVAMMPKMIKQFTSLYETHFMVYQTVSRNLYDTFHENYQTLTTASLTEAIADPFILPLMNMSDMKDSLDTAVNNMKTDIQLQNFHTFLFDHPEIWNTGDEHKISKEVSHYLVNVFSEYTNKSLTDYLTIRFNTTNPAELTNLVYRDILEPLRDKAEALFWKASGFDISVAQPLGYISIPDSASIIISAANKLTQVESCLTECPSKMKDRIFLLKCLCGVPLYAYNGVRDYSNGYRNDTTIGKHLYERTLRDATDWRTLPNLQPYSQNNSPSEEIEKRARIYDEAVNRGIIRQNPNAVSEYQLVIWPPIDELIKEAQAARLGDVPQIKHVIDAIENYKNTRQPQRIKSVPNDGTSGHKEKVRKDHVVDSAEMIADICAELAKEDQLNTLLEELQQEVETRGTGMLKKENFFNAVYSGVITVNIPKISYSEEKFGMTTEVVLSEPRMDPFGKFVPLYQAFKTYEEMSNDQRGKLDQATETRLNDPAWRAAMQDSCDRLTETFNDRYLGLMQQQAVKLPEHTQKIVEFLIEFRQGIENFRIMNGLA